MGLYRAQFLSMIIMIALGVGVFVGMNMEWYSIDKTPLTCLMPQALLTTGLSPKTVFLRRMPIKLQPLTVWMRYPVIFPFKWM